MRLRRSKKLPSTIKLAPRRRRHRKLIAGVIVIALIVFLDRYGFLSRRPQKDHVPPDVHNAADAAVYHDRTFSVVHVVDGDTLDLGVADPSTGKSKTRVRLWGVDCPEVAHGGNAGMHFGQQATEFAKGQLLGRPVRILLSPRQTRDKFGRLLAYIITTEEGSVMLNEQLIEQGFCYADPRFDHHYETRFTAAERRAKQDQLGLWKGVKLADMPKWRQKRESSQFDRETHAP